MDSRCWSRIGERPVESSPPKRSAKRSRWLHPALHHQRERSECFAVQVATLRPGKRLAPVSTVGFFDLVMVVDSNSKIGSVGELSHSPSQSRQTQYRPRSISAARRTSLPELFKSMSGIEAQVVPFKATPAVVIALKGNDVQWL